MVCSTRLLPVFVSKTMEPKPNFTEPRTLHSRLVEKLAMAGHVVGGATIKVSAINLLVGAGVEDDASSWFLQIESGLRSPADSMQKVEA
jgi:hypothetical protein